MPTVKKRFKVRNVAIFICESLALAGSWGMFGLQEEPHLRVGFLLGGVEAMSDEEKRL